MNINTCQHGIPSAHVDPIRSAADALPMITLAMNRPLRDETIVLLLDEARRGLGVVVVSGTADPDAVIEVVECLANPLAHDGQLRALVVASIRSEAPFEPFYANPDEIEDDDIERWIEMRDIASAAGIDVAEWFVVGREIISPRYLLGDASRW